MLRDAEQSHTHSDGGKERASFGNPLGQCTGGGVAKMPGGEENQGVFIRQARLDVILTNHIQRYLRVSNRHKECCGRSIAVSGSGAEAGRA